MQTWNDELAYVSCFNAKTCVFAHDDCRNTGKQIKKMFQNDVINYYNIALHQYKVGT